MAAAGIELARAWLEKDSLFAESLSQMAAWLGLLAWLDTILQVWGLQQQQHSMLLHKNNMFNTVMHSINICNQLKGMIQILQE